MIYISHSPAQTKELASKLAEKIKKLSHKRAVVIAMEGELGAGKTTFIQGFAKALGIRVKIKSPTFVLMKNYKKPPYILYHIDCYRLEDHKGLIPLGIKDILNDSHSIIMIEWAERVRKILPAKHITVHIDHINTKTRKIYIQ